MTSHIPSQILPGDTERIRQHSFTRWMSRDLLLAATDFCKHIGLTSLYSECSPEGFTRYLLWSPPLGARVEVRSGRTLDQFSKIDQANMDKGWPLLSLHVSENDLHSAVWITPDHYEAAVSILTLYGITPARRAAA